MRLVFDLKVDVYSFGVTMWEIWTLGQDVYPGLDTPELLYGIMSGNMRPDIPEDCDDQWVRIMENCWSRNPKDRPAFTDIAQALQDLEEVYSNMAPDRPRRPKVVF